MKITCQSCQSKYTIADDKVLGKVVKIRCKKCAATIFVNGSDGTTSVGSDTDNEPLSRYRAENVPEGWTVNVADGEQKTMTDEQVVIAFQAGTINAETFLWKDGMPDWVPLREAGELFRSCTASATTAAPSMAAKRAPSPQAFAEPAAPLAKSSWQDAGAPTGSNGSSVGFPQAAAARRAGGRGAGVDLFGGVAQAGGEADVVTSAPAKIPQAHEAPQMATGARNESSVLFSLSAMTSQSNSEPPPRQHGDEASGLIDIRQLSAQIGIEDKKQSRVDDIMNLSGGGAFSPTLMAPTLSAPAFDAYAPDSSGHGVSPAGGRNKGVILLALGASACVLVAAVGGAYFWMRGRPSADTEAPSSSASAAESVATPSASVAVAAPPSTTEAPAASGAAPGASASAANPEATAKPAAASDTKMATSAPAVKESPSPPVARPAAAPAVEAGPFNMGEARARLGAAAAAAAGCKKPGGPTGTGRVVVLFAPGGGTQSAAVSGPPFEGTPTGACVAARFRAVRVPPFSGSPFSVSKSFTVN
jgi:predicted Zn finger-like uncharacterized protein